VLDHVQQGLMSAEAEAAKREREAASLWVPDERDAERALAWKQRMVRIEDRLQGWQRSIVQADKEVREADEAMRGCEDALVRWHAAAESIRQKLANGAGGGVS
jgi:hypothetical protein